MSKEFTAALAAIIGAIIGAIATFSSAWITSGGGEFDAEVLRMTATAESNALEQQIAAIVKETVDAQATQNFDVPLSTPDISLTETSIAVEINSQVSTVQANIQPLPTYTLYPTSTPLPTYTPFPTPTESIAQPVIDTPTATTTDVSTRGPKTVVVDVSKDSSNYGNSVILIVDEIEVLDNGRMRWHISFWNRTNESASMAFGEDRSYVTDEFGTRYSILSMSPSGFIDSGVRAGVRLSGYLDFDAPSSGAKNFKLFLVRWTYGFQQLVYDGPIEVFLNEPLVTD